MKPSKRTKLVTIMILPDDITVVLKDFPPGKIHEAVRQRPDGTFLVMIDARLNQIRQLEEYEHALKHIRNGDFEKADVQQIEAEAHGITVEPKAVREWVTKRRRAKARWEKMMEKRYSYCYDHNIDPIEHALDRRDRHDMDYPG